MGGGKTFSFRRNGICSKFRLRNGHLIRPLVESYVMAYRMNIAVGRPLLSQLAICLKSFDEMCVIAVCSRLLPKPRRKCVAAWEDLHSLIIGAE